MRLSIQVEIESRGVPRLREPVLWPVFFGVDDAVVRFLMGDLSAGEYVFATGSARRNVASWQGNLSIGGIGAEHALVGVALHYTEGGADNDEARARYADLVSWTKGVLLTHAARSFGLGSLLAAFGGTGASEGGNDAAGRAQLLAGFDPLEERDRVDGELLHGLDAFMPTADALRPFRGGTATAQPIAVGTEPSSAKEPGRGPTPGPGTVRLPRLPDVSRRLAERVPGLPIVDRLIPDRVGLVAPGTVVAAILQAWPIGSVESREPWVASRPLRSSSVRRLSLVMRTTVRRED